jgi:hypothetical protein
MLVFPQNNSFLDDLHSKGVVAQELVSRESIYMDVDFGAEPAATASQILLSLRVQNNGRAPPINPEHTLNEAVAVRFGAQIQYPSGSCSERRVFFAIGRCVRFS